MLSLFVRAALAALTVLVFYAVNAHLYRRHRRRLHGLIHPDRMLGGRLLVPGSAHATPIRGLYLCGAGCHPGPGVTFLPGHGAAYEVADALARVEL